MRGATYGPAMNPLRSLAIITTAVALIGCGKKEETRTTPQSFNAAISNNNSGNPLTAPVDYLGAVAKGQQTAVKSLDVSVLKQAIMLFHEAEDRFPTDLNELVKLGHLRELPKAPYGIRLDYDAKTGTVKAVTL